MRKNCSILFMMCLILGFNQIVFAQGNPKFDEYLKKNPELEKSYKVVKESFQKDPTTETMTNDLINWHKGLINSDLAGPVKKLIEAWVKDPANYGTSKEYGKAEKTFNKIVAESFKKDDKFKKQLGSDDYAKWLFNTGAFLASVSNSFTIYEQEQARSYRVESIIILHYTWALMNIVNTDTRDEAKVSDTFKKFTEKLLKWVDGIPADLRK
jgi:hypothetical protein